MDDFNAAYKIAIRIVKRPCEGLNIKLPTLGMDKNLSGQQIVFTAKDRILLRDFLDRLFNKIDGDRPALAVERNGILTVPLPKHVLRLDSRQGLHCLVPCHDLSFVINYEGGIWHQINYIGQPLL